MERMSELKHRLANLLTVKSLVTIALTGVFAYLAIAERINQDFMTIYAVIIAFYFGTQRTKEDGREKAPDSELESMKVGGTIE